MQTTTLPEGWGLKGSHPDDYEAGITPDAIDGKAAAYLRARVASSGFGTIMQQFKADAYRGQRLRLAALVRSEGVERWAGLWMRVDGPGRHSLAFDNMQNRGITGTTGLDAVQRCARCRRAREHIHRIRCAVIGCRTDLDGRRANRARRSGGAHDGRAAATRPSDQS